jgi:hypothetical protein
MEGSNHKENQNRVGGVRQRVYFSVEFCPADARSVRQLPLLEL